jgi:hypothetical protein
MSWRGVKVYLLPPSDFRLPSVASPVRPNAVSTPFVSNEERVMTTANHGNPPRIARIWRGRTTAAKADEYARYLRETGIPPLEEKALGVQMFREDQDGESEFVTISYWESVEAMSRFAGDDPRRIHHLPRDPEYLIELPESVQVLQIVEQKLPVIDRAER